MHARIVLILSSVTGAMKSSLRSSVMEHVMKSSRSSLLKSIMLEWVPSNLWDSSWSSHGISQVREDSSDCYGDISQVCVDTAPCVLATNRFQVQGLASSCYWQFPASWSINWSRISYMMVPKILDVALDLSFPLIVHFNFHSQSFDDSDLFQ
ncbi:hypothetical protein Nepgr_026595 [Nepenthes gracilis]|uniref:Uncharacterized protein n=1 Tax=Nepenthes gracilis TaxID=150966 RepID=A0AAD3TA14_NEPGR|nr:hypothetical protein Nepgr_026595 [Nepenthes gracilis]